MFLALNIAATEIGLPSIYLACGLFESSPASAASTFAASHPGLRPPTAGAWLSQHGEKGSPKASAVPKGPCGWDVPSVAAEGAADPLALPIVLGLAGCLLGLNHKAFSSPGRTQDRRCEDCFCAADTAPAAEG